MVGLHLCQTLACLRFNTVHVDHPVVAKGAVMSELVSRGLSEADPFCGAAMSAGMAEKNVVASSSTSV